MSDEDQRVKNRDAQKRYRDRLRREFPPPPRGGKDIPDGVRFAKMIRDSTIDPRTDCWLWNRSVNKTGYGQLYWGGTINRAHRVSAHVFLGFDLESDLHVLHLCDVRRCVNPAHLFIGTNADNMADRNAKGHLRQGAECAQAKLDERKVRHIRVLFEAGATKRQIADYYGVSRATVRHVVERRTWRHVA